MSAAPAAGVTGAAGVMSAAPGGRRDRRGRRDFCPAPGKEARGIELGGRLGTDRAAVT